MCILFIYTDPSPPKGGYRAVIASNRDEFYRRPAKFAYQCDKTGVIGGRDMEPNRENGMWLGISARQTKQFKFRFGALLNVTGEDKRAAVASRGFVVTHYLEDAIPAKSYIDKLQEIQDGCNAFNFVAVELGSEFAEIYHNSNAPNNLELFSGKQVLGFGNSTVKDPLAKVTAGKKLFQEILDQYNHVKDKELIRQELINLLKAEHRYLPDPELERRLHNSYEPISAIYVKYLSAGYGTRTHSVILVDYDWNIEFLEESMLEPIDPEKPSWNSVIINTTPTSMECRL